MIACSLVIFWEDSFKKFLFTFFNQNIASSTVWSCFGKICKVFFWFVKFKKKKKKEKRKKTCLHQSNQVKSCFGLF